MDDPGIRLPEGLELQLTSEPARWALERMSDREARYILWDSMPSGYDRYLRILHPLRDRGDSTGSLRWHALASRASLPMAPDATLREVVGLDRLDDAWLDEFGPLEGSLSQATVDALLRVLRSHTSTPNDLWMAVWDGWGGPWSRFAAGRTVLERPFGRRYVLLRGAIKDVAGITGQTPQLWWPDDRGWFVSTEIDSVSTYLGCSAPCADAVASAAAIEAIDVPLQVRLDGGVR